MNFELNYEYEQLARDKKNVDGRLSDALIENGN